MQISSANLKILLLVSILTQGCAITAKQGTVAGTLSYEDGSAIKHAHVSVYAPGQMGRPVANEVGAFSFSGIPIGNHDVEFHCPSASQGPGRLIEKRKITVRNEETVNLKVVAREGFCFEPPYSERQVTLEGNFSHGFESSGLTVCEPEKLGLSENVFFEKPLIWVYLEPGHREHLPSNTLLRVYAKGTLKGPGSFGHMGVADYGFFLDEIISSEQVDEDRCN